MNFFLPLIFYFGILCDPTPGTIQVGDNLYFDQREVTHDQYKQYVAWLMHVFGEESKMWKNALPGTYYIDTVNGIKEILPSSFFLDNKYDKHPVVNISFEQATNFCQWRSDRVYESVLTIFGLIQNNQIQSENNFFTIKKYIDTLPADQPILGYAIYRLPTPDEWEMISTQNFVEKKFQTKYTSLNSVTSTRILDMFGGVAEMTSTQGLSKGGSYVDELNSSDKMYDGATAWLGFRCICSMKHQDTWLTQKKLAKNNSLIQQISIRSFSN